MRWSAAAARDGLAAGRLLIEDDERYVERRSWRLAMSDSVRDRLNRQPLDIADGFLARGPVAHRARQLEGLRDPAAVLFPLKLDGQLHTPIIA